MSDLPEVTVTATRYTVSLLPANDINHHTYALNVVLRHDGWGITDGFSWIEGPGGHWHIDRHEALTFAELDDALALARRLAPGYRVNGRTAAEAYRITHPTT